VTQYWEDEEQAGIVLEDGTKVSHFVSPHLILRILADSV
jgi:hypothetical protein